MHVKEYIKQNHNGNKSEFARLNNVFPSHVVYWCKNDYYVCEGKLFHLTRYIK